MFRTILLITSLRRNSDIVILMSESFTWHEKTQYKKSDNIEFNKTRFVSLLTSSDNIEKWMCEIDILRIDNTCMWKLKIFRNWLKNVVTEVWHAVLFLLLYINDSNHKFIIKEAHLKYCSLIEHKQCQNTLTMWITVFNLSLMLNFTITQILL